MIDKRPAPGNWTEGLMDEFWHEEVPPPELHIPVPVRPSCVLGPDGEPVMVVVPRRAVGFDLTRKETA